MALNNSIFTVEVAYAPDADIQHLSIVTAHRGETVRHIIERSQILKRCPDINLSTQKVGIFGKLVELTETVAPGDRIELYRPLCIDPKEARRAKAKRDLLNRR